MSRFLKQVFTFALALGLSAAAYAHPWKDKDRTHWDPPTPRTAPEVDAALAAGGLALVGGTITVLRARRRK